MWIHTGKGGFGLGAGEHKTSDENDESLVEHIVRRQIEPQLKAAEMGVPAPLVYTGPQELEGSVRITCAGCGKTAQILGLSPEEVALLEAQAPLCPDCMHLVKGG